MFYDEWGLVFYVELGLVFYVEWGVRVLHVTVQIM